MNMNNLETRLQKKNVCFNEEIAKFLKRRRIEMGLKLEDLCNGICSASYLSRIENNLVSVDDNYFQLLCEKMNINYEEVKKDRTRNIYLDLLKDYLSDNLEGIESTIKHAIESKSYVGTELELIVLFNNIINGLYEESRKLLITIERVSDQLSNGELLFFMYCFTLYAYRTNQNKKAYQHVLIMTNITYDDMFFEACLYDLAIDVMYVTNNQTLWWKYYNQFEKLANHYDFRKKLLLHKLQMLEFESHINLENVLDEYDRIASYLSLDKYEESEKFYYHLAKCYYINHQYDIAVECIFKVKPSVRMSAILASCLLHLHNVDYINKIIELFNNYGFTKYEKIYQDYYIFIKIMMEGNNNYILLNYYKTILNNDNEFYDGFLETEKHKLFIEIILGCSKYKEGIKYLKKYNELTLHDKLK